MKIIIYITLGFAMGSLITSYYNKNHKNDPSQADQSIKASEPVENTTRVLYAPSFELADFRPRSKQHDFSKVYQGAEIPLGDFDIYLMTTIYNKNDPNNLSAMEEWKNRDYGLYILPSS